MKTLFILLACSLSLCAKAQFDDGSALLAWQRSQAGGGSATTFITAYTPTSLRSDFDGEVGFYFTVGGANITVSDLGRWIVSGNSQSHTVTIYNTLCVSVASVSINASGKPAGAFSYASITPTILLAGQQYYILSSETSGGDQWYDRASGSTLSHTAVATVDGAGYSTGAGSCSQQANNNDSYVPVSFKYTSP